MTYCLSCGRPLGRRFLVASRNYCDPCLVMLHRKEKAS